MLEQPFEVNGILGKVKPRNLALQSFEGALYTKKLYKVYSDIPTDVRMALNMTFSQSTESSTSPDGEENSTGKVSIQEIAGADMIRPDIKASLSMSAQIDDFCQRAAPRVADLVADVQWYRAAKVTPEQLDAMFQFWLEHEDFREEVDKIIEAMDFPNGKAGASAEMLTPEELKDPLSVAPELNTETIFKNGRKIELGAGMETSHPA